MTHIHIIEPYHTHAMLRMAQPLFNMGFENITAGEVIDPDADLNFHIPWHGLANLKETKSVQGMLYTHCNPNAQDDLRRACNRADFIVAMSNTGKRELIDLDVPAEKITVIYAGHSNFKPRRRNIGIIGREQPNGRKRSHILLDLCWLADVNNYNFLIVGEGWDDTAKKMINSGANVAVLKELNEEDLQEFYNHIDCLLVTGYIEGGPLTVLEAMSAGVPVIAPPVGYAKDLLHPMSIYRSVDELVNALKLHFARIYGLSELVKDCTWKAYTEKHAALFRKVLNA